MTKRFRKNVKRAFQLTAAAAILGATTIVFFAEQKLSHLVVGGLGESFSTRIYSSPAIIDSAARRDPEEILQRLARLSYRRTRGRPPEPGTYNWSPPVLSVYLRGFRSPHFNQDASLVRFLQENDFHWSVRDTAGVSLGRAALEPEMMAELSGPQKVRRDPATWEEFPQNLLNAVVAVEDRRFFHHWGLDPRAIARAAWHNVSRRASIEGGSTITQQLAKNLFLKPNRTMWRKTQEAALALYLTVRYSKQRILTLYLNHIYMGQDGFVSVAGMKAAARYYFDKDLGALSLGECATLAGVIRSPHLYSPFENADAARRRRNLVLKNMENEGFIGRADDEQAKAEPLRTAASKSAPEPNGDEYFVAEVVRQLLPNFSEDELFRHGLKIFTTMDPLLQKAAHAALQIPRPPAPKRRGSRPPPAQAALVCIDPNTGQVLALSGGRSFQESQFNRATQAMRQPGSAFKPFVFGAALEQNVTPATLLLDEPRAYSDGKSGIWAPQNFDNVYYGTVTVRQALALSLNAATLNLAEEIGPGHIVRFAQKLGIESPMESKLSVALGVFEVTPMELTGAYAAFANGGFRVKPYLVTAVVDAEDDVLDLAGPRRTSVIEPAMAYLMTSLLESTVREGTAKSLSTLGWTVRSAGKTGTTNDGRDAWFVGYTFDLLTGVWTGNDAGETADLTGGRNAVPLWARFMTVAYEHRLSGDFTKPIGLRTVLIDPVSGLLPRSGCPQRSEEIFIVGTEPKEYCHLHAGGLKGWIQRIFNAK